MDFAIITASLYISTNSFADSLRVGSNGGTRMQEKTQFTIVQKPMRGIPNGSWERGLGVAKYSRN